MFGKTLTLLETAMNASGLRHRVISGNVANADTPGYKRSFVSFEDEMALWLEKEDKLGLLSTDPRHLKGLGGKTPQARVIQDMTDSMKLDGNNVDVDRENAEMAKNTLYYNTLATQVYQYFSQLRTAMRDR